MDKKKILVLDDSRTALEIARRALEAHYEVYTAPSLQDFEYKYPKVEPDGILVDINMPEIFGDDVCRVLKECYGFTGVPILLFSDVNEEELKRRAEEACANGYISKGWGAQRLLDVVTQAVGR